MSSLVCSQIENVLIFSSSSNYSKPKNEAYYYGMTANTRYNNAIPATLFLDEHTKARILYVSVISRNSLINAASIA